MKGPYQRLKYDLRRVWECPVCGHKERTTGAVTSRICGCQAQAPPAEQKPMRLIEDGPRRVASADASRPPASAEDTPASGSGPQ